jgi:RNA polymerase sigma-70 factor (ECF subfamily)
MAEGLTNAEVTEIHRRYGYFLRRRCQVIMRDRALADDAMQEVLMKLLRHGVPFREAPHPMRWLHRVTDRACFDLFRRGRRAREATPIEEAEQLVHPGVSPEVRRAIADALAVLSEEEQQVAVMAFVDGMSQQEIADELGYSRVTVNKRIAAIRRRVGVMEQAEEVGT